MQFLEEYKCPECGIVFQAERNDVFRDGDKRICPSCRAWVTIDLPPTPLDTTQYGLSLAERVADFLQAGGEIPVRHPYFNSVCLAQVGEAFLYGYANEAGAPAFCDSTPIIRRFTDRAAFVAWLSSQSDDRLNRGPDTGLGSPGEVGITRRLLEAAVGSDPVEPSAAADCEDL